MENFIHVHRDNDDVYCDEYKDVEFQDLLRFCKYLTENASGELLLV